MNEEIPAPAQDLSAETPRQRPALITVLCVIGFAGAVMSVPVIFSDFARGVGAWYPPYITLSAAASTVCFIGLWKMRRWAAYLYAGFVVVNQVVMAAMGVWHPLDLLVPGIFAAAVLSQFRKMR